MKEGNEDKHKQVKRGSGKPREGWGNGMPFASTDGLDAIHSGESQPALS